MTAIQHCGDFERFRGYVWRSMHTIVRIFALYRPFRFFAYIGALPVVLGVLLCIPWVLLNIFEYPYSGRTHVSSLIVAAVLLLIGFQIWVLGFVADLLAANPRTWDEIVFSVRREFTPQSSVDEVSSEELRGEGRSAKL
jgi:hypothetical protein